jgi:hypothetical protein
MEFLKAPAAPGAWLKAVNSTVSGRAKHWRRSGARGAQQQRLMPLHLRRSRSV